eukprot:TRINITY_DN124_c0_g2_i1.p1 TRINITY_DN124_c0_g2~~TRINITY_DN124_c0_g2_i1.p1  ORF type:complete len:219 (+),score=33.82 TRINITY_DN124_c0_g2_i1:23-679(+)
MTILGESPTSHLAFADLSSEGPASRKCIELAMKHSSAVDFVKTGIPSTLEPEYIPNTYPDYFEKSKRKTHRSNKILGKLYREVALDEDLKLSQYGRVKLDPDLAIDEKEISSLEVRSTTQLCRCYYNNLRDIMNQYGLPSEVEAITGDFLRVPKYRGKGEFQIRDSVMIDVERLRETQRKVFLKNLDLKKVHMRTFLTQTGFKEKATNLVYCGLWKSA